MLIYPTRTVSNVGMPQHKRLNLTCPNLVLHSASQPGPLPGDFHLGESALYPAMLEHLSLNFSSLHITAHQNLPLAFSPPTYSMPDVLFFTSSVTTAQMTVTADSLLQELLQLSLPPSPFCMLS